jgi:hypothetical protein
MARKIFEHGPPPASETGAAPTCRETANASRALAALSAFR